jgi:NAD(P)-dependent dehydrogenase (short-subunit alcohol dehydrogenase family)
MNKNIIIIGAGPKLGFAMAKQFGLVVMKKV